MLQAMATCAEPMYVERLAIVWMMRLNRSLSVACLTDRWLADFSPANGVVELLSRLDGGRPCSLPRVLQNDLWMRLPPRLTKLNAALSVCSIPCPAYVSGSLPICIMPYSPIGIATFLASSAACMKIFFRLRLPALATNHRRLLRWGPVLPPGRGVPRLPRRLLLPQSVGQASPPQGVLTVGPRPGALRRRAIYGFLRPRRPLPRPCRCPRLRLIRVVGRFVGSFPAGSTRLRGPRRTPRAMTTSVDGGICACAPSQPPAFAIAVKPGTPLGESPVLHSHLPTEVLSVPKACAGRHRFLPRILKGEIVSYRAL